MQFSFMDTHLSRDNSLEDITGPEVKKLRKTDREDGNKILDNSIFGQLPKDLFSPFPFFPMVNLGFDIALQSVQASPLSRNVKQLSLKLSEEPDNFQISNYNVQGQVTIELSFPAEKNGVIKAELLEHTNDQILPKGFKTGDLQTVAAQSRLVSFSGLKLNVMKVLKTEVQGLNMAVRDTIFRIRFTIDDAMIETQPFRIVSSFSQLPKDLQQKRNSRLARENNNNQ